MTDRPLEPRSNPSQNSQIRAATDNQSSVSATDYPAEDRRMQTLGATSGAPADGDKPSQNAPSGPTPTAPTTPGKAEGDDDAAPPGKGSPQA